MENASTTCSDGRVTETAFAEVEVVLGVVASELVGRARPLTIAAQDIGKRVGGTDWNDSK